MQDGWSRSSTLRNSVVSCASFFAAGFVAPPPGGPATARRRAWPQLQPYGISRSVLIPPFARRRVNPLRRQRTNREREALTSYFAATL